MTKKSVWDRPSWWLFALTMLIVVVFGLLMIIGTTFTGDAHPPSRDLPE